MSIKKFRASRVNNTTPSTYVGQPGDIFYDEVTGQLKISDGTTAGGHYINLVVATSTQLGGIKAGPGAVVGPDGLLTIDTSGLPLNVGDLAITQANISTVNGNENLNLFTNGTGTINLVGNLDIHTTAQGPDYPTPLMTVRQDGNLTVNGNLITNGGTYFVGYVSFIGPTSHTGNLTTNGNLITNGSSYFNGNVTEIGNLTVTGNSVNNGATVFNGLSTFNGNTVRTGSMTSTGDVTWNGNLTTNGTAVNNGNTIFNGNVTTNGNLSIVGNTVQQGNLTITGTTVNNGLSVFVGNINMVGNTIQSGSTYLIGNTYVTGNTFQTGSAIFTVTQQNSTQGAVEITGDPNSLYQTPINTGVMLHVTGQSNLPNRFYVDAMGNYNVVTGRRFEGTMASPTGVQGNIDLVRYSGAPYTTAGWANIGPARMTITTNEIQTATNQGGRIEFWTTANSAGPAYSTITRTATIDPALGVTATGFVTTGNVTAANVNATVHGNVIGSASNVTTNSTSTAGTFLSGQISASVIIAKNGTSQDLTYTVAGLTTSHKVMAIPAQDMPTGTWLTAAYPTASNTLGLQFQNTQAAGVNATVNITYWAWI